MIRRYLLIILFLSLFIGRGFAATYYAKNGTQEWNTTTAWNLTSSAGIGDVAAQPTAGDTIIFDSNYNGTMYVAGNGNSFGGNITSQAGATGSIIHNATKQLYVYGNFTMGNLTYTATANTCLTGFNGNGTITIKDGSLFGNVSFGDYAPSRTYILESNLSLLASNCRVMLTNGTLLLDGATNSSGLTHNWGSFSSSNTNVREINWGNATVNFNDTGTVFSIATNTNLTFNAGTSTINVLGNGATLASGNAAGANSWNNVNFLGGNAQTLSGSTSFTVINNLSVVNATSFTLVNTSVTNSINLVSNSSNRMLVKSGSTFGIGKFLNITGATITGINNVDFRDIGIINTIVPLNLASNSSGDCLGNKNITFTPSQDQHWVCADGGNWSNSSCWTSRVPLPQDNVFMDCAFNAGANVTADVLRIGKTVDWTGATGTPTFNTSLTEIDLFGGLTLISAMSNNHAGNPYYFYGRDAYNLLTNGKGFQSGAFKVFMINGTLTCLDSITATGTIQIENGEFDANDFNISTGIYDLDGTSAHTFRMGNGTLTAIGTGSFWDADPSTALTIIPEQSTIFYNFSSSSIKFFRGGNLTYNNLTIANNGTGQLAITGNNTFNSMVLLPDTSVGSVFINFTSGDTQIVNSFSAVGDTTHPIIINSSTASSPAYLYDSTGRNVLTYCNITDITANATGARWWAFNDTNTHLRTSGFITSNPTVTFTNMTLRNITFN